MTERMTEREKMLSSVLYDPMDPDLTRQRDKARRVSAQFNQTDEGDPGERRKLLEELLGAFGEDSEMNPHVKFDYGCNTYIGKNCYFNFNCTILDCGEVRFGDNVLVGPNVSFLTPLHPLLAEERNYRRDENGRRYILEYCKPITIEDNVWFGGSVTVNAGVTIGHDSVIGSGSVVTRDIPPGVLAAGVPCRVIRPLTERDRMAQAPGL